MTRVLVIEEKHDTRYLDASTPENLAKSCINVLRKRLADGYWYHREFAADQPTFSKENQEIFDMTEEQVKALPSHLQETMTSVQKRLQRNLDIYTENKKLEDSWWSALNLVLNSPIEEAVKFVGTDADETFPAKQNLALSVLEARSDYQYEGMRFITVEQL